MRSGHLPAYLSVNCPSSGVVSCSLCFFFYLIPIRNHIFQKFNSCVTYQRTDRRTDTPSYRDARTYLLRNRWKWGGTGGLEGVIGRWCPKGKLWSERNMIMEKKEAVMRIWGLCHPFSPWHLVALGCHTMTECPWQEEKKIGFFFGGGGVLGEKFKKRKGEKGKGLMSEGWSSAV